MDEDAGGRLKGDGGRIDGAVRDMDEGGFDGRAEFDRLAESDLAEVGGLV